MTGCTWLQNNIIRLLSISRQTLFYRRRSNYKYTYIIGCPGSIWQTNAIQFRQLDPLGGGSPCIYHGRSESNARLTRDGLRLTLDISIRKFSDGTCILIIIVVEAATAAETAFVLTWRVLLSRQDCSVNLYAAPSCGITVRSILENHLLFNATAQITVAQLGWCKRGL